MPENHSKKNRKGKPKMFLLFLFVAAFIWFLSKFSREFTANLETEIEYINIPHGVVIEDRNSETLSFDLTTSGFDFLFYKINKPIIFIDLTSYYEKSSSAITISNNELKRIITAQLKNDIVVNNVSIESIELLIDKLKTKKVKISLLENIEFAKGYKSVGDYIFVPDSIDISGPAHHLDTLNEISTVLLDIKNVSESISTSIDLDISKDASISYSQNSVNLTILVKEFTQKTMAIPLTISNLPADLNLKLIPPHVNVKFDVPMEDFNSIDASEFTVVCDFNKKNEEESFMIPQLIGHPESLFNIELKESKIDYLILK